MSLVSVLVVARILGPKDYGIVSVVLGLYYFFSWLGKFGLPTYLIRQPDLQENTFQQILAFFNTTGLATCLLCWLAAPAFGWWTGHSEVTAIIRWLPIPLWLEAVASVSISRQERDLGFAQIGVIETISQISNYIVTVPLVFMQWSYWAPIAGLVTQAAVLAIAARRLHPIPFQWRWNWSAVRPALRYGLAFASADWIASLRVLTVPLIVTRFAGLEAAGIISIAIRLVEQVSTLRLVLRRMSISIMSKLVDDAYSIKKAISYGMAYQAIIVGFTCAIFACAAGWIVPLVFGSEWLLSSKIFPLIAFAMMVKSTFDLHNSALNAIGKNLEVAWRNFVYIVLLWLGCILLIPSFGLWGYGIAEILALPSYWLVHRALTTLYGSIDYSQALWFTAAAVPALVAGNYLPIALSFGVLVGSYSTLLFIPSTRKVILEIWSVIRSRGAKAEA
ncbi:oligosaccharide flippase family protein [Microcoleus sp. FACHB-1515]|nr:oligosaccharide flippase family protein [Microcoleus sp. FACHB-1515]